MSEWWSWALALVGIFGIWLAGRKNRWGWAVGLASQGLWIAFALATRQYGFLLSALGYGTVYGLNLWQWSRERRAALVAGSPTATPYRVGEDQTHRQWARR